jgi:MFS family permease
MALPETKEDYKRSRIYYTTADTATQTIAQLVGGTFFASLMSYCGISDANIGIISSLVSLAALSQLFLINFFKRLKKYKFLVCITSLQRILFSVIYLIPLLAISSSMKGIIIVLLYFVGQIFVQIGLPASQDWIASLVPSRLRGKYFSIKDSVAVFVVSTTMLLAGIILDFFTDQNIVTGFILISIMIFLLTMLNVICLSNMKEPRVSYVNENGKEMHGRLAKKAMQSEIAASTEGLSIWQEIKEALRNRKFRKAFTIQCIYTFSFFICAPFNSSYQIKDLSLPYTFIMVIAFIANLYRIFITPKLGRLADRFGMARMLRYSLLCLGLNFLILALTVPGNAYLMTIIGTFFSATAWSFIGIGLFGIQLDFFRSDKRMTWLTITSSVSGVLGFFVSILGGILLDYLQKSNLILFGSRIYAQQVLNFLGFLVTLFAAYYIRFHMETEKIDANRSDGRVNI